MGTVTDLFTRERQPDPPEVHETDESALVALGEALDAEEGMPDALQASVDAVDALERDLAATLLAAPGPRISAAARTALAAALVATVMEAEWAPMVIIEADA